MCSLANSDSKAGSFQSMSLASASQPAEEPQTSGLGRLAEDGQVWAFLTNREAAHIERRADLISTVPPRQRNTEQQNYVR